MRRRTLRIDQLRTTTVSPNVVKYAKKRQEAAKQERLEEEDRQRARQIQPNLSRDTRLVVPHQFPPKPSLTGRYRHDKEAAKSAVRPVLEQPNVSVIVPCFNSSFFFGSSILSLLDQTHPVAELVVVDDGSDVDFAHTFGKSPRYYFIRQPHANGNVARNRGFSLTTGDFVLFADSDCIYRPTMIERLLAVLISNPSAAYAYCDFTLRAMDSDKTAVHSSGPFDAGRLKNLNYIDTKSLIRRPFFTGFDESVLRYQDWDLWLSMLQCGYRGAYIPENLFTSIMHPRSVSRTVPNATRLTRLMRQRYAGSSYPIRDVPPYLHWRNDLQPAQEPLERVSVVVPALGSRNEVVECVSDLIRRQADEGLQVIVVDVGLDDGLTDYLYEQPGILVIRSPRRESFSRCVNLGVRLASYSTIAVQLPSVRTESGFYAGAARYFRSFDCPASMSFSRTDWRGSEPAFLVSHEVFCALGGFDETVDGLEYRDFTIRAGHLGLSCHSYDVHEIRTDHIVGQASEEAQYFFSLKHPE